MGVSTPSTLLVLQVYKQDLLAAGLLIFDGLTDVLSQFFLSECSIT